MFFYSPNKELKTNFPNNKTKNQSPSLPIHRAPITKTTKLEIGCKTQHGEKHQIDFKLRTTKLPK
jgi:hypothetical protein